jgi:tetratricopeptide (TPR) repeat protein
MTTQRGANDRHVHVRRARPRLRLAAALAGWLASTACGGQDSTSTTATPATAETTGNAATAAATRADHIVLRPTPLPDLSPMAATVQQQIRDQHARLVALAANTAAPPLELSEAYAGRGKLLMAAQAYDAAEPCLLNAQTLNPADPRWPYYLAQIARTLGQPDKALPLFERVRQLQPDDVTTLVWLGETQLQLGRPQAAEPPFARALALQETSVSARYGLGRAALAENDYPRAVTYLEEVLKRDPKASSAHYPLSLAYEALGNKAKAAEHLRLRGTREILPADPLMVDLEGLLNSAQTYETQGIRALEREDFTTAADQFRKGLALAPDSAALHHRLGAALVGLGDKPSARREFEAAVGLQPTYFLALYSLGVLHQEEGRHEEAIARFKAALAARPIYTEARVRLASSLRRAGHPQEALAEYQQVLSANADLTEARLGAAMTLAQLGRYRDARERLVAAAASGPDQPTFQHALARLLVTAPDGALRDGQRAMGLVQQLVQQGRSLELGETMAMTLAELGEFDRAVAIQRDLITGATRNNVTTVLPRLQANLARYQRREPSRTPWTREEGP